MRSFVAFAALALSAADLASAGPCKPRPTATADVTETSAGGADATTLPEPPTNVPIVNACEGGGMTDLSQFKTEGDVSSNRQEGFTKDGSPDTACAQLAAVSSGPLGKRETAGDVAALKQTLTGLNTRTKYTVQFYYRVFSSPSEATACTLEAYIGDVQFFNTDILANGASASYDQVLVSTSVDAAEGDLNIKTTCTNGGSASVFVDSIFISNQVTPENIDNYRLDFGDGQIREPANLPATTAIPPTTEDGAATGTVVPEATTTAASGDDNGSNNSAASTSAIEGEATSNPTQGGDSQPTQGGSSPTTIADGGSSEPTDAAGNGGDKSTQTQGSDSQPTEGSGSDSQTTTVAGGDSSQTTSAAVNNGDDSSTQTQGNGSQTTTVAGGDSSQNTSAAEDQDSDSTSSQTQGSNSQSTSVSQSEGSETTEAASDATATSSSSESSQSASVASSGSDSTSVSSGSDSTSAPVDAITTTTVAVSESTSAPADDITTITISVSESASVPTDVITTTTAADSESTSAPADATTTITADETTTTSPPSETTEAFVARAEPARTQCLNTANSVQNGDFEDSNDAGNHWTFTGTAQVVQNNEISSNAHTIGNNGVGFVGPDTGSFTQTVDNLEAGENYSLGVAYYIASGEGLADNQCTVKVTLAGDEVVSFDPFADSDAWNNYRNKITQIAPSATEGVLSFELNCQGQPAAFTLMMDDIFL
ncbi:hypothetical protein ACLX1H_000422 [Fusarium chlamydosporum]